MSTPTAGPATSSRLMHLWRSVPLVSQLGPVAVGLVVMGLGSFAYLTVTAHALGPTDFAPLATLWVLFNGAALALFQPIEQEVSRATAARRALGVGARPVLVKAVAYGLMAIAVVAAVLLATSGALTDRVFNGSGALVPLLLVGLVGLASEHTMRGVFGGNEKFNRYGLQLGVDGALRIIGPLLLAVTASRSVAAFGLVLVLAPLIAAVATAGRLGPLAKPGPALEWRQIAPPLLALTGGAVLSQLIVNAAPIAAQAFAGHGASKAAGIFIAALVLTRMPLFFFGAVQAAFLPALARLSATGQVKAFDRQLRQVLALVSGVGGLFILLMAAIGPFVLRLLYGNDFVAGRTVLVPLAVSAALYMIAQVIAQTLIALRAYRASLLGWAAGSVVFLLFLLIPDGLELRVGSAFFAGSLAALLTLSVFLRSRRRGLLDAQETA